MAKDSGLTEGKLKRHENGTDKSFSKSVVECFAQQEATKAYHRAHRQAIAPTADGQDSIQDVHDSLDTLRAEYPPGEEGLGVYRTREVQGIDPMHHFMVASTEDSLPILARQCLEDGGVGLGVMEDTQKRSCTADEMYENYIGSLKKRRKQKYETRVMVAKESRQRKRASEPEMAEEEAGQDVHPTHAGNPEHEGHD